jgi:phage baseplate assembly protein W
MSRNTGITYPIYSDFMTDLDPHPVTGDLAVLSNEDAVKRSIRNLVLTMFYESPFQPKKGSQVLASLFENFTPVTEALVRDSILNVIKNFEPRAGAVDVKVTPYIDENAYVATVVFYVANKTVPVSVDIVLDRVR